MGMMEKFVNIDQFGAMFSLSIQGNDTQYKSFSGAIATLCINLLSAFYFAYLIFQWTGDQLLPKITSLTRFYKNGTTFYLTQTPFFFNMEAYDPELTALVEGKKIYDITRNNFYDGIEIFDEKYQTNCSDHYEGDLFKPVCVDLTDKCTKIKIIILKIRGSQHKIFQIIIQMTTLDLSSILVILMVLIQLLINYYIDSNCLPLDQTEIFLSSQSVYARITTYSQEFDIKSNEFNLIPFDFYYYLNPSTSTMVNIYLTIKQIKIIRGLIFPTEELKQFISKVDIIPQTIPRVEGDPFTSIWVNLQRVQLEVEMEYPRLPEIMSQFTFVFSGLMTFGLIFSYFNNKSLKKKIYNQIGEIYFENYSSFEQIQQNSVKIHPSESIQRGLKEKINKHIEDKCNLLNLIFEISKLQMAIQTIFTKEQIANIQLMKYSLEDANQMEEKDLKNRLNFEHFNLFCQGSIKKNQINLGKQNSLNNFQLNLNKIILGNINEFLELKIYESKDIDMESVKQKEQEMKASPQQMSFQLDQINFLERNKSQ